ncbi:MAG: gas vesicle protein [Calditrichota bacterium]
MTPDFSSVDESDNVSLCELLDRVLNKGVVIVGDVTISVANIDLIYLSLNLILTSIETARKLQDPPPAEITGTDG